MTRRDGARWSREEQEVRVCRCHLESTTFIYLTSQRKSCRIVIDSEHDFVGMETNG